MSKRSILIVDDEKDLLEPIVQGLRGLGYNVVAEPDVNSALETAMFESFDLVVSDINMPKMSGFDLLKELRQELPELPVLLMTAFEQKYGAKALSSGAADVIFKPFEIEELDARIKKIFDHKETKKEKKKLEAANLEVLAVLQEEIESGLLPDLEERIEELAPCAYAYSRTFELEAYKEYLGSQNSNAFTSGTQGLNRTLHTLKGTAGMGGLVGLQNYAHRLEDMTQAVAEGRAPFTKPACDLLQEAPNVVSRFLVDLEEGGDCSSIDVDSEIAALEKMHSDLLALMKDEVIDLKTVWKKTDTQSQAAQKKLRVAVALDAYNHLVEEAVDLAQEGMSLMRRNGIQSDRYSARADSLLNQMIAAPKAPIDLARYRRVLADLQGRLGKKIEFVVPRNDACALPDIWERCHAALIHLVRNAADHGIEVPELRVAAEKDEKGTISLETYEDYKNLYLNLEDDGGGIDVDKISRAAVEKGLVTKSELAEMPRSEVLKLVFREVSTKEEVSDISGRGLGMGAALEEIEKVLGGDIRVESQRNKGTRVSIEIPKVNVLTECVLFGDSPTSSDKDQMYAIPDVGEIHYLPYKPNDVSMTLDRYPTYCGDALSVPPFPVLDVMALLGHKRPHSSMTTIIQLGDPPDHFGLVVPQAKGNRMLNIERCSDDVELVFGYAVIGDRPIVVLEPELLSPAKAKDDGLEWAVQATQNLKGAA